MEYLQRIPKPREEVQVGIICLKRCRWKAIAQKVQIIPPRKDGEMEYEVMVSVILPDSRKE